jgi:MSHA pilin protein MshD
MHTPASQRGFTFIELVMFIVIVGIAVSAITLLFIQNVRYSADPLIRQKSIAVAKAYMDEIVRKRWDELSPEGGGCIDTTATSNCDPKWQANTAYNVGDRAQPLNLPFNSHIYEVVATSGNNRSGGTEPAWPTDGTTVIDNNVTWQDLDAPAIGANSTELRYQFDDVDDYHGTNDSPPQFPNSNDAVDGESPMPGYDGFRVTVSVGHPATAWEGIAVEDVKQVDLDVHSPTGETMTFRIYRVNY